MAPEFFTNQQPTGARPLERVANERFTSFSTGDKNGYAKIGTFAVKRGRDGVQFAVYHDFAENFGGKIEK